MSVPMGVSAHIRGSKDANCDAFSNAFFAASMPCYPFGRNLSDRDYNTSEWTLFDAKGVNGSPGTDMPQRNDIPGIVARQVLLPSVLPAARNGKSIFEGVLGAVGALVFSADTNMALLA